MKPYYSNDGISIYHGDCREVISELEPDSIDLVVTDPPYGVRWRSNYRMNRFDFIEGDEDTEAAVTGIGMCLRVLRIRRHVYAFGRYDFSSLMVSGVTELIWDKGNSTGGNIELPWGKQHEYIQFLVNVRSNSSKERGQGELSARLRRGSIIRVPRVGGTAVKNHPTEKPVLLLRQLIESSSRIGETVLDPFMGVGSTLVAASLEGRQSIGIEIEEKFCEVAARRLSECAS